MKIKTKGCGLLEDSNSLSKEQQNGVQCIINANIITTYEHPRTSLKLQRN